ncbi:DNA translocase FtsK [uncultured Cohaesibacter sp.]|uniref:DNA translocase FtsK n=1 Tax=uncultured Cohaesibacter sp. TaxID=1002546 RepID=UPI0029C8B875|nr:DNA translocase FtsK [uncultured Cohaesibacter sp.]
MASAELNSPAEDRQEDMFQPKEEQATPQCPPSDKVLKIAARAAITSERKASTSFVQRRLNIGYNRAASIIEDLEQEGFISPPNHVGKRQILQSENHPT